MLAEDHFRLIAVANKEGVVDAVGTGLCGDIRDLGIDQIEQVEYIRIYALHGLLSSAEAHLVGTKLLADPVTQRYTLPGNPALRVEPGSWGVEVWYHPGVTDNEGATTRKGAQDLGVKGINRVETGRGYILKGGITRAQVDTICRRLLANEVIERTICYEGSE